MVQVLTVSATTAGYVADSIRAIQRPSRKAEVEQAVRELGQRTGQSVETDSNVMKAIVNPSAMSGHFLTAGQNQNPQATLEEVIEAYEDNKGQSDI